MATETAERRAAHRRGVKVTTTATLLGVVAGLVSSAMATGPSDRVGVAVVVGAIIASLGVMRVLGVDVEEFSTKDHLYVAFMTISLWFITWTILLSTGASL